VFNTVTLQVCYVPQQNHFELHTQSGDQETNDTIPFMEFARGVEISQNNFVSIKLGDVTINNPSPTLKIYLSHALDTARRFRRENLESRN